MTDTLRILRVANIPDNRTGGMARAMYMSGDVLTKRGHHVEYLFSAAFGPCDGRVGRLRTPWKLPGLVKSLGRHGHHFDVVEVHEPLAFAYAISRRWDRQLPPVVAFSHGLESRARSALRAYRKTAGLKNTLTSRLPSPQTSLGDVGLRMADHVVCLNTEDQRELVNRGISPNRITLARSGVDDAYLTAGVNPPDPGREGKMLYLGSWIDRKGVRELVTAVSEILSRAPGTHFTAAGVACDESLILAEFPEALRHRITVVPKIVGDENLIRLYRNHKLFLLPSVFEGQPLVMLEAAALRLAIVTTPVCGMKDFIRDGVNGLFVPVGDGMRLADACITLLNNPAQAGRLGDAAHQSAHDHTWDRVGDIILSAYRTAHNRGRVA